MKSLLATTEDFIKLERTELDADVAAGSNVTLTLVNNNGLDNSYFIVVGREGSESAELATINDTITDGTHVRVATLLRPHKKGEPITRYRYNQRKFYGCATATGVFTELTADGSPKAIQVDDPQGTLLEYTGTAYSYFKSTYYDSVSTLETDIADSVAVLANEAARYTSLYAIRVQAGLTQNPYIDDGRIERKRLQAENEINSAIITRYTLPLAEVPPLIQRLCELFAAGYLDFEEFGPEGQGVKWLGEARGILKAIQDGRQRLLAADLTELGTNGKTNVLRGKPDGSETGDETRKFTIGQVF